MNNLNKIIKFANFLNKQNKFFHKQVKPVSKFKHYNNLYQINKSFFSSPATQAETGAKDVPLSPARSKIVNESKDDIDIKYEDLIYFFNRDWDNVVIEKFK